MAAPPRGGPGAAEEDDPSGAAAFAARWAAADDEPPPLESLPEQMAALRASDAPAGGGAAAASPAGAAGGSSPPGAAAARATAAAAPSGVRRGFFDAPKARATPQKAAPPAMTELHAAPRAPGPRGAASVPDFMKIKPDADAAAAMAAKAKLTEALKPSADMMDAIMANPALMQGFDDPDVMAAVAEVAQNPTAYVKHAHKPAVRAFYAAMAGVAGEKLERVAAAQQPAPAAAASATGAAAAKGAPSAAAAPAAAQPPPPPLPRCVITELD